MTWFLCPGLKDYDGNPYDYPTPGNSAGDLFLGWLSDPFKGWKGDLQLGDEKVAVNQLVTIVWGCLCFLLLFPKNPGPSRSNRIDGLNPSHSHVIGLDRGNPGFLGYTNGFSGNQFVCSNVKMCPTLEKEDLPPNGVHLPTPLDPWWA